MFSWLGVGSSMHLVFNERAKLTASWFNTLATALIAAGAFAPAVAFLYGLSVLPFSGGTLIVLVLGLFPSRHLPTCGWLGTAWEAPRMSILEIMVFAAPVLAVVVVISFGCFMMWLNERVERRKAR